MQIGEEVIATVPGCTSLSGCSGNGGVGAGAGLAEPAAADEQGLGLGGFAGFASGDWVSKIRGFAIDGLAFGFGGFGDLAIGHGFLFKEVEVGCF